MFLSHRTIKQSVGNLDFFFLNIGFEGETFFYLTIQYYILYFMTTLIFNNNFSG